MYFNNPPNYLLIGHVTKDNTPAGPILGGTCSYAALTAQRLGQQVAMVTRVGPNIPSLAILPNITIKYRPHPHSTTFENIYHGKERTQKWLAQSGSLTLADVPPIWQQATIVHLAPVSQEMPPSLCGDFANSLVCATIQGWLRERNNQLTVIYQPYPDLEKWLAQLDILVLSPGDVPDRVIRERYLNLAKIGVETLGAGGCRIYQQGHQTDISVLPETEVDPTGAGDIFATSFFIYYQKTGDYIEAGKFANACASLSVTNVGLNSVPYLKAVEAKKVRLYG